MSLKVVFFQSKYAYIYILSVMVISSLILFTFSAKAEMFNEVSALTGSSFFGNFNQKSSSGIEL